MEDHSWFLSIAERGNPATGIDTRRGDSRAWTVGNLCRPLVDGRNYFLRLHESLCALQAGDWVHFTDWRGDADERVAGPGTEIGDVLTELAARDVHVRGLFWRSHFGGGFSEGQNAHFAARVNDAGGCVLLDERVRRAGSHHQKLFVLRRPEDGSKDVAFAGGIDLCHGRNDDAEHLGDPQAIVIDDRFGPRPPWHDAQLEVRGPAVGDLAYTFRERWEDPTPLDHRNPVRRVVSKLTAQPRRPSPLPPLPPDPPACGTHSVQVLRTYPTKRPSYPFAPEGERSVARAYRKAMRRARSFVYVEDQYLWSAEIAETLAEALQAQPGLRLIVVVPRFPDRDGKVSGPPNLVGQVEAVELVRGAGGDRVAFYDLESREGWPIYVHAKVCIVDDVWCTIGSDNFNRRSWTHDSELTCAVVDDERDTREPTDPAGLGDGARRFARNLRLRLWAEHLGRPADDPALVDPTGAFALWRQAAEARKAWRDSGRRGDQPRGRVAPHEPQPVPAWARSWARPFYRYFADPDGRPAHLQREHEF